jgi:DNA polymerase III subunit beta
MEILTTTKVQVAEFSLEKKEAQKMIRALGSVVNMNTILPILECVRIVVGKSGVVMFATDLQNVIRVEPRISSYLGEISVCVPHRCLQWFFNKATEDVVTVSFKDGKCFMKSGDVNITVWTDKEENFPKYPEKLETEYISHFSAKDIIPLLRPSLSFVGKDDLRPAMTGVQLVKYSGNLTICATDAHKMYYKSIHNYDGNVNAILPRRFVQALCDHFNKTDFELIIDPNYVAAKGDGIKLLSRRIDSRFPNWAVAIPNTSYEFSINRRELLRRLELISFFGNQCTYQTKIEITQKEIKLHSGDMDFSTSGAFSVPIESFSGFHAKESLLFAVNSKFFIEALRVNTKDELVTIRHTGTATGAILIDGCILIMPLLLNEM